MAKEKPTYEVVEDAGKNLETLISLNDDKFGHIDAKMIRMVMITNKEPNGELFKIIKVGNPVAMFCPFRYIIVVYKEDWDSFGENFRGLLFLKVLHHLEPDEDEPKLIAPDIKDHRSMLKTFGVDYMANPEIVDIFTKPVDWKD